MDADHPRKGVIFRCRFTLGTAAYSGWWARYCMASSVSNELMRGITEPRSRGVGPPTAPRDTTYGAQPPLASASSSSIAAPFSPIMVAG